MLLDIDSDLAPEVRERVIDYVREKYRSADPKVREDGTPICSIITKGTMAARAAIRNVARVTNIPDSIADELANLVPKEPHAKIDDIPDLEKRCTESHVVRKLITDAKLVEGTTINYGVHAAGVIIADNGDVGEYAPLYRNITKNQATGPWVAQLDMGQCENDAGLLKMDFLGLINLDVITDTLRRVYRNYGTRIDVENLPEEPEVFRDIFAAGNTDSVFQFESDGMKRMLREFRPTSMEDLILLVAAYRPGPMDDIPKIIKSKFGKEVPKYIADGLEEILAPTYGYPIYQEQVMQIFNRVADFSLGESDIIRRAMSKKKLAVLTDPKTDYKGKFIEGLKRHGANEEDANDFWERLLAFASYAFNKSHAAAYATISYMTAWLKYHYTAEYMCSVMMRTNFEKLPKLVNVCRKSGLRIAPPDINRSQDGFINEENSILFGFGDIKGVGNAGTYIVAEREARGAFHSVKDFVMRMLSNENSAGYDRGVMEALIKAGAFDAFCDHNRSSLLNSIDEYTAAAKKLVEKRNQFATRSAALEKLRAEGATADAIKKAERSLASCEKALTVASEVCSQHNFIITHEDVSKRLEAEYELLGMYVSGNPFSVYTDAAAKVRNRTDIVDVGQYGEGWMTKVCGVIKDLRVLQRKKDGMPFAAFTLFDESGEVDVKCFVKSYEKYSEYIDEGAAITVAGKTRLDSYTADDGSTIEKGVYITAEEIAPLRRNSNERIIFVGASVLDYTENEAKIREYESASGCAAFFVDAVDGQLRALDFLVAKDIVDAKLHGLSVSISRV